MDVEVNVENANGPGSGSGSGILIQSLCREVKVKVEKVVALEVGVEVE